MVLASILRSEGVPEGVQVHMELELLHRGGRGIAPREPLRPGEGLLPGLERDVDRILNDPVAQCRGLTRAGGREAEGGDTSDMVRAMTLDGYPYPWQMLVVSSGAGSRPRSIPAKSRIVAES